MLGPLEYCLCMACTNQLVLSKDAFASVVPASNNIGQGFVRIVPNLEHGRVTPLTASAELLESGSSRACPSFLEPPDGLGARDQGFRV